MNKVIAEKILQVQAKCKPIGKSGQYSTATSRYKYTPWTEVIKEVKKNLVAAELNISFRFHKFKPGNFNDPQYGKFIQVTYSVDFVGATEEGIEFDSIEDQENIIRVYKGDDYIKRIGAAQSYIRKYFYIQLFNLEVPEDDSDAYVPAPHRGEGTPIKSVPARKNTNSPSWIEARNIIKSAIDDPAMQGDANWITRNRFWELARKVGGPKGLKFGSWTEEQLRQLKTEMDTINLIIPTPSPAAPDPEPEPPSEEKQQQEEELTEEIKWS